MAKWCTETPKWQTAPSLKGCEPVKLFQWEICVQFSLHRASTKYPTSDVRDKLKSLIIKLQEVHGKEKFLLFTEKARESRSKCSLQKLWTCIDCLIT
eukprot:15337364-Ditylum_brightwellii.AAC.1